MSGIAEVLDSIFQRIDPQDRRRAYQVWRFWEEEVGAAIAARAQPAGYRGGILSVRVSSHAWMQELQFLKESLRERLNQRLGRELIRDIYFVLAADEAGTADETRQRAPRVVTCTASAPIPPLADPRLAEAFERLARAHGEPRRPTRKRGSS